MFCNFELVSYKNRNETKILGKENLRGLGDLKYPSDIKTKRDMMKN